MWPYGGWGVVCRERGGRERGGEREGEREREGEGERERGVERGGESLARSTFSLFNPDSPSWSRVIGAD